jgi:hypothetical protein
MFICQGQITNMPKVQLHSEKVPQGILVKEREIAGEISHEKVLGKSGKVEVKETSV